MKSRQTGTYKLCHTVAITYDIPSLFSVPFTWEAKFPHVANDNIPLFDFDLMIEFEFEFEFDLKFSYFEFKPWGWMTNI